jgi:hypothetical protein
MAIAWRCALILLAAPAFVVHAQAPAAPAPPAKTTARPARVVVDLSSFHLDQSPHSSAPNQVGAASRGSGQTIILCAPTQGFAATVRPIFEWHASEPGEALTLSLLSDAGDVLYEGSVTGSSFQYPADAQALAPGQSYSWKVSGGGMDKLPDPVSFTVEKKAADLAKELAAPDAADPLAQAQVYLHHRLWYDAVETLEQGIREKPARSDLKDQLQAMYKQVAPGCAQ